MAILYFTILFIVHGDVTVMFIILYSGVEKTAKLTVLANDSPYGVFRWERTTYSAVEPDQSDANIILYIVREQGLAGDLQVTYRLELGDSCMKIFYLGRIYWLEIFVYVNMPV